MLEEPVGRFLVTFRPKREDTPGCGSFGCTDAEGRFELFNLQGHKGAFAGEYVVQLNPAPSTSSADDPGDLAPAGTRLKIPSAFMNSTSSPLVAVVPPGGCHVEIQLGDDVEDAKVVTD